MFNKILKKDKSVNCPAYVLFEILEEDLQLGICCDITFIWNEKKYQIGAYGDDGNTYKNVKYYFNKDEYDTLDELKAKAKLDNDKIFNYDKDIRILECDGLYPKGIKQLEKYCSVDMKK